MKPLTMKKILSTLFVFMLFASTAFAQHESEIAAIQAHFKDNSKKNIIRKYMKLEGETSTKFWAIYDEYEAARHKYVEVQQETLVKYVKEFDTITDEQAEEILDAVMERRVAETALRLKHLRRMERELGGLISLKFAEIDHYVDLVTEKAFSESIPFIGEDW